MGTFLITAPNGKKYKVTGATQEGALAALKARLEPQREVPLAQVNREGKTSLNADTEPQWSDLAGNIPGSAVKAATGLYEGAKQLIMHPDETASAINDVLTGAENKIPGILALKKAVGFNVESAEEVARKDAIANAAGKALHDRYGTPENIKRTLITDPVGVALDVGTVASGGSTALAKVPGAAKAVTALDTVAAVTNPVNAVVKPAAAAVKAVTKAPVQDLEVLRTMKNKAYGDVSKAGVVIQPRAVNGLVGAIGRAMVRDKFNPARHEKTAALIPTLQSIENTSPTLTQLDQLRQVVYRDLAKAADPAEAHFGQLIIKSIDKFVDNLSPPMVVSGDPRKATKLLREAREANKRYRKTEMIMDAIDRGERQAAVTGSGANVDNTLRQRANAIINDKRKFNTLSAEEKALLLEVVRGTKTGNTLRLAGKLAPTGVVSGGIGSMIGAGIGGAIAGPAGATFGAGVVPGLGLLAKTAGDASTKRGLEDLLRVVQSGKAPKKVNVRDPGAFNALYLLGEMQADR